MSGDDLEGQLINGKYRVLKRLGTGGMGMVYLANVEGPAGFEKLVALKVMHAHIAHDVQVVEMFLSEARLSAHLAHANVAQIYDLGESDGLYYIAMEYVRGRDLRALCTAVDAFEGRIPLPLCVYVVAKLCEGLDHAHTLRDKNGTPLNLVHRDVTPVNCLLSFAGEVKVIDFGIARAANVASRTRTGMIRGKLAYMSPEQTRGTPLDRRSDIFALGVILYELLIGGRPFDLQDDNEMALIGRIRSGEHPGVREMDPEIPLELDRIVEKALAVDREQRYANAGAMQEDLQRFLLAQQIHVAAKDLGAFLIEMIGPDTARADGAAPAELSAKASLARKKDGTTQLRARVTQPEQQPVAKPGKTNPPVKAVAPPVARAMPTESDLPPVTLRGEGGTRFTGTVVAPPPSRPELDPRTLPGAPVTHAELDPRTLPGAPVTHAEHTPETLHDVPVSRHPPEHTPETLHDVPFSRHPPEHTPETLHDVPFSRAGQTPETLHDRPSAPRAITAEPTRIAPVPTRIAPVPTPTRKLTEPARPSRAHEQQTGRKGSSGALVGLAVLLALGAVGGVAWLKGGDGEAVPPARDLPRKPEPVHEAPKPKPEPVVVVPPPVEPVEVEPVKVEPVKVEPVKVEPPLVKPEPRKLVAVPREVKQPKAEPRVEPKPEPRADPPPKVEPPPALAPMAFVTVRANQPSEVFIDGRSIGKTPRLRAVVAPGKHELRVDCMSASGPARGAPKHLELEADEEAVVNQECKDTAPP